MGALRSRGSQVALVPGVGGMSTWTRTGVLAPLSVHGVNYRSYSAAQSPNKDRLSSILEDAVPEGRVDASSFAEVASRDIVARCRAREINTVATILSKTLNKPNKRHTILKKHTAKWSKEYDWLSSWLSGFLDGDVRPVSLPVDNAMVTNKLVSAIRQSYVNRIDHLFERNELDGLSADG